MSKLTATFTIGFSVTEIIRSNYNIAKYFTIYFAALLRGHELQTL